MISAELYVNEGWNPTNGGHRRLFPADAVDLVDVLELESLGERTGIPMLLLVQCTDADSRHQESGKRAAQALDVRNSKAKFWTPTLPGVKTKFWTPTLPGVCPGRARKARRAPDVQN